MPTNPENYTKPTPGPWYVSEEWAATNRYEIISKPQMVPVATVAHDVYDENDLAEKDQADANAHLIAAAPELLEVAELAFNFMANILHNDDLTEHEQSVYDAARAAIRKAKGE